MKNLYLTFSLLFALSSGYSQCNNNPLNLGPDTVVCVGDYFLFNAGSGYTSYSWSNGTSGHYINVNTAGTYSCTIQTGSATNLVTNGDFSSGNTGFTSSYVYGTGGSWGLLSNPGQYAISTNANLTHNNFPSCTDHTSGTGNYMIMNGSSVANTNVWCQTITVTPNTTYDFSAWFTSVVSGSPAQLNFTVDGVALGAVFNLSSTTCSWTQYNRTWTSGTAQTIANICIRSQSTAGGGNDFAIDDIKFSTICSYSDTVVLSLDTMPIANIGPDTVICSGSNYTIDATDNASFGYAWSNGATIPVTTITATDSNLIITVTNGMCEAYDTAIVTFSSQPIIDLGNDTTLCPGDSLVLNPEWPNANYLWSDNTSNNTLTVSSPGVYKVTVTDNCGFTIDSINVGFVTFPLVDLGNDTNICDGSILTLNAAYSNASYTWNTGSIDSTIDVFQTGQYWVNVTVGSCLDQDTINVNVDPFPVVNLGADTTLCTGETHVIQANNLNATYLWNDGATGAAKFINSPGMYWVNVSIGNCELADTIVIDYLDYPIVELGSDTFICGNNTVTFDVSQPNVNYLWNDGSTDSVLTIGQTTKVWVEVSNFCGVESDTVNVYVNPYPVVNLGNDTAICVGESFSRNVFNVGATYQWDNGSVDPANTFNATGTYFVTVTANHCEVIDTLYVDVQDLPVVDLGYDTIICTKSDYQLILTSTYDSVLWVDGSDGDRIVIQEPGGYWVQVTEGVCVNSDTIWIGMENCETYVHMPNIFTPNNDGVNDVFMPEYYVGVNEMRTQIYDRWGKIVYETNKFTIEWDGTNKNDEPMADGVYYWIIDMIGLDNEQLTQKGTVTLLR